MMPPDPSDDWRWRRSIQLAIVEMPRDDIGSRTYRDLAANGSYGMRRHCDGDSSRQPAQRRMRSMYRASPTWRLVGRAADVSPLRTRRRAPAEPMYWPKTLRVGPTDPV